MLLKWHSPSCFFLLFIFQWRFDGNTSYHQTFLRPSKYVSAQRPGLKQMTIAKRTRLMSIPDCILPLVNWPQAFLIIDTCLR